MPTQLPNALTPDGCDMSGNDWFPMYYDRLLGSRWWRGATDLARSRNIDLWAHAFKEVPAASLPDDDVELAGFAGYGRDVDGFRKHKAEIMEPWVKCSDGRWYHPTLAEVATDVWNRMSARRRADKERKARERQRIRQGLDGPRAADVTRDEGAKEAADPPPSHVTEPPVTRDTPTQSRVTPADVTRDEGTQRARRQTGQTSPLPPEGGGALVEAAFAAWNETARRCELPVAKGLTDTRRRAIRKRLEENGPEDWLRALAAVERSKFCRGLKPNSSFRADLTFVCQAKSFQRLIEGYYGADVDPPSSGEATSERSAEDVWRSRLYGWRVSWTWDRDWGPKPGKPGCLCPVELMIEAGVIAGDTVVPFQGRERANA